MKYVCLFSVGKKDVIIDQNLMFEELGRFQTYVKKGFKIVQDQEKTTPSGILTYIYHTNQPFM